MTKMCPLECGLKMKKGEVDHHIKEHCRERQVECEECGQFFKFKSQLVPPYCIFPPVIIKKILKTNNKASDM